jgi:Circadian oscillating protein COP23
MLAAGIILSVTVNLQLPVIAKDDKYFCRTETSQKGENIPLTIVRTRRGDEIPLIYWLSEYFSPSNRTPIERCKKTSRQLQKYYENGWLKYIRTDYIKGFGVICVSRTQGGNCLNKDIITILPPNIDRSEALGRLTNLSRILDKPLFLSNQIITYKDGEAYIDIIEFLNDR